MSDMSIGTMIEPPLKTRLISVVIPCFNMGRYLAEALTSVGRQTHLQWEAVVVDDAGPDDGTRAAVELFARDFRQQRVVYLRHDTNQGVSAARNTGIAAARGSLVAFLDPDDVWLPDHLARHLSIREKRSSLLVSASSLQMFGESQPSDHDVGYGITPWEEQIFPYSLAVRNPIPPSAVLVDKKLLDRVGGFDPTPEIQHIEDWDLWLRLEAAGAPFVFIHEPTVRYRKHPQAATADPVALRTRLNALVAKHGAAGWVANLATATSLLSHHVDELDRRLFRLETNPLVRLAERLRRLISRLSR